MVGSKRQPFRITIYYCFNTIGHLLQKHLGHPFCFCCYSPSASEKPHHPSNWTKERRREAHLPFSCLECCHVGPFHFVKDNLQPYIVHQLCHAHLCGCNIQEVRTQKTLYLLRARCNFGCIQKQKSKHWLVSESPDFYHCMKFYHCLSNLDSMYSI